MGAIYLDLGYYSQNPSLKKILIKAKNRLKNYNCKSKILEWSQKHNKKYTL